MAPCRGDSWHLSSYLPHTIRREMLRSQHGEKKDDIVLLCVLSTGHRVLAVLLSVLLKTPNCSLQQVEK